MRDEGLHQDAAFAGRIRNVGFELQWTKLPCQLVHLVNLLGPDLDVFELAGATNYVKQLGIVWEREAAQHLVERGDRLILRRAKKVPNGSSGLV